MHSTQLDREAVDYVLTTTRVVRKRLDFQRPVPRQVIEEAIRVAVQAPTADDLPRWHWYVVDAPQIKTRFKEALDLMVATPKYSPGGYREMVESIGATNRLGARASGVENLTANFHRVPVFVIPAIENPVPLEDIPASEINSATILLASIFPAAWSLHLALRVRGLVSAWGSWLLSSPEGTEAVRRLVGMASDHHPVGMFPVAYPLGGTDFKSAGRGIGGVVHWNNSALSQR